MRKVSLSTFNKHVMLLLNGGDEAYFKIEKKYGKRYTTKIMRRISEIEQRQDWI